MKFTVVLHTDDGRRYGVTVPDLPGCFSAGDSMDEALESVREAIDLHAETLIEDGDDNPLRSLIDVHRANPDYAGGVWAVGAVTEFMSTSAQCRHFFEMDMYNECMGLRSSLRRRQHSR